jgi:hypothetical protein
VGRRWCPVGCCDLITWLIGEKSSAGAQINQDLVLLAEQELLPLVRQLVDAPPSTVVVLIVRDGVVVRALALVGLHLLGGEDVACAAPARVLGTLRGSANDTICDFHVSDVLAAGGKTVTPLNGV